MASDLIEGNPPPQVIVREKTPIRPIFDSRPKRIWLVSFTDFMSLMVAFFVMMYSMADPQLDKFKKVSTAFEDQFSAIDPMPARSFQGPPLQTGDAEPSTLPRVEHREGLDIGYLTQIVDRKRAEIPSLKGLRMETDSESILLRMPMGDIFGKGSTTSKPVIKGLARLLSGMPNQVELMVDAASEKDLSAAASLALITAREIQAAGYAGTMPILVRELGSGAEAMLTLRMTRFGDDDAMP